ncbi:hypothetical protein EV702DRAFT_1047173 [Suillus placidus]|uniref:DUF6532 domain-containing protein n=1 Tax=Suillus placidus TaxID=48579 RepID=A0A9P7D0J5_9AGAM|nr:hypothetical protein EV702DRAFT_1047173 [Suillus placidus]
MLGQDKQQAKQKKRALKATYQDNPDDFEKEPSVLHSDSDQDEDTMFSDHALQTKLSNTKVLAFSMGKIPPASHITSGSARQLKAPVFDSNNTNDQSSSDNPDETDKNNDPQLDLEAGAGQSNEEDNNSVEEQMPATRVTKRPLDTEDAATVAPKMKKHSDGSRHRVKVTDFDDVSKDILMTAISIFRCLIITQAPFPESIAVETSLGKEAWNEACQLKGINIKLMPSAIKMLLKRTSHVCSAMVYMTFQVLTVIALVLTAGVKEDIKFTAAAYGSVYNNHLDLLQHFDQHTAPYKLFEKICDNLHDVARFHAGVDAPTTFSDASRISDEAFEDAIREHQLQEEIAWSSTPMNYNLLLVYYSCTLWCSIALYSAMEHDIVTSVAM